MSLVKCKECGKEISTKAAACPHCGAKARSSSSGCLIVTLSVVGMLMFISMFSGYKSPATTAASGSADQTFDPVVTARGMCMLQVKSQLHDPSSAEFEHSSSATVTHSGDIWTVVRPVRAKNLMNATQRSLFECRYKLTGRDFTLLGIKQLN